MQGESTDDRRRYPRSRRGVSIIQDDAGPGLLNHVDNISGAGVLCHTVRPVPLMTKIGIALELPKPFTHRIDAEGVVVRCEADDYGDDHFKVAILFTRLKPEDQDAINHFVNHDLDTPDDEEA
jgi:hypothetical protein